MLRMPTFLKKSPSPPPPVPGDHDDDGDGEILDSSILGVVNLDEVPQRVRKLFRDPRYQPPTPPAVALELLALTRKNEIDFNAATQLFMRDPILAGRVLKVARSPLYGAAVVPTIRDAVIRLGARRLNHVVLEAALELRVFRSAVWGPWMERVRRHSVAVGNIASRLAHLGSVDPDQALMAGLVHDIGTAAAIGAVGDRHQEFSDVDSAALASVFDDLHVEVGAIVADVWQLPAEVKAVVSGHHHIGKIGPMIAVIVVAEAFAIDAGVGNDLDPFVDDDLVAAKAELGLSEHSMRQLGKDLAPLIDTLR
jgi:putative nucleotidyltransferase with HDIG domain